MSFQEKLKVIPIPLFVLMVDNRRNSEELSTTPREKQTDGFFMTFLYFL